MQLFLCVTPDNFLAAQRPGSPAAEGRRVNPIVRQLAKSTNARTRRPDACDDGRFGGLGRSSPTGRPVELCLDVEGENVEPLDFIGVQKITVA